MSLPGFILTTLLLLLLISTVYHRSALKKVSYSRYFSATTVYEGERIEMVEEITNRKLLPLPWLRLESSISRGLEFGSQENLDVSNGEIYQNHISMFFLRSYRKIKRRHQIRCEQRGLYRLESVTMTAGDLFGMSRSSKTFPLQLELLVYPGILEIQELPLPIHSWLGELPVKRWIVEDPFLTAGTREYSPGDSLGSVNWKATARTGALQVHRKDHTADTRLILCLNVEISDTMWRNITDTARIERGIRYAATIADYAAGHGLETALLWNGRIEGGSEHDAVAGGQTGSLDEMLGLLARLKLDWSIPMSRLMEQEAESWPTDNDYLIISCHRGQELQLAAEELQRLGNGVAWLDIPDEGRDSA